ncbi:alpha/beta fold hydrolase [bacterium]|nr:alpha/beta fold hydrolase [bacterium]
METISFTGAENKQLILHKWAVKTPSAILYLLHGMNDHSMRFSEMAHFFTAANITVYAADHRGHGLSASDEERGHIADKNGWRLLLDDLHILLKKIEDENRGVPIFLFGHSMGSFIARNIIEEKGERYVGVILSGVAHFSLVELQGYLTAVKPALKLLGPKYRSNFVFSIGLKGLNRKEKDKKSQYDWLSSDRSVGERFAADPLNPKSNSLQFVIDLLKLIERMQDIELVRKIPKDLPMLIFSGDKDPVGKYGESLIHIEKLYKKAGLLSVKAELLRDMRHEPQHELSKEQWFYELLQWIRSVIDESN